MKIYGVSSMALIVVTLFVISLPGWPMHEHQWICVGIMFLALALFACTMCLTEPGSAVEFDGLPDGTYMVVLMEEGAFLLKRFNAKGACYTFYSCTKPTSDFPVKRMFIKKGKEFNLITGD
ncbi:MAG: hypothetical protein ACD_8C00133G0015 [uncultured bacterium]|nr:MAG: hypothetical protein ACD_8C00133G0015 [uncultured bacterium]